MSNAFAPILRARPCPIFGRPVHPGSPPIDYSPILLLKPFGFRITPDTLSSSEISRWPARHYPRLWIQRPSSERRRDFNPPDSCAAQRTIRPCPTPAWSTAVSGVEAATYRPRRVSPDYPHHYSDVPCPLPRRTRQVHVSIASLSTRPSPVWSQVGVRIHSFEALLRLYSRYGPPDRSTAQGGLCHEASTWPVA